MVFRYACGLVAFLVFDSDTIFVVNVWFAPSMIFLGCFNFLLFVLVIFLFVVEVGLLYSSACWYAACCVYLDVCAMGCTYFVCFVALHSSCELVVVCLVGLFCG